MRKCSSTVFRFGDLLQKHNTEFIEAGAMEPSPDEIKSTKNQKAEALAVSLEVEPDFLDLKELLKEKDVSEMNHAKKFTAYTVGGKLYFHSDKGATVEDTDVLFSFGAGRPSSAALRSDVSDVFNWLFPALCLSLIRGWVAG